MPTNKKQKKQHRYTSEYIQDDAEYRKRRELKITGSGGTPVYYEAFLDFDGHFFDGKQVWWEEYFVQEKRLPLSDFKNTELWLGGEHIVSLQKHVTGGDYDKGWDANIGDSGDYSYQGVCLYLEHNRGTIKLDANICEWPKEQRDRSISPDSFLGYLVDTVAELEPRNKYVNLSYIIFDNRLRVK